MTFYKPYLIGAPFGASYAKILQFGMDNVLYLDHLETNNNHGQHDVVKNGFVGRYVQPLPSTLRLAALKGNLFFEFFF